MKKTERKRRRISLATRARSRCVVQFADDVMLPVGRFDGAALIELDLGPARVLLKRFPGLVFSPVFSSRPRQSGVASNRRTQPPRFENFRYVDGPWATEFDALAVELEEWRTVRGAQVDHPSRDPVFVPGPAVNHPDGRLYQQLYLNAAPGGVDAKYAWRFPGGNGAGVGFADVERGWKKAHPDFDNLTFDQVRGDNFYRSKDHGAGVIGIVAAGAGNDADLAGGIVGIANGVTDVKLSGILEKTLVTDADLAPGDTAVAINLALMGADYEGAAEAFSSATGIPASAITPWVQWDETLFGNEWTIWHSENVADAIDVAASHLAAGDVLLVETQEDGWPEEIVDVVFTAIRDAADDGIVVIEVAGNGGGDLNSYGGAERILHREPGNPHFRDSGAIMVGGSTSVVPHERHGQSNFGQRIDCFAWAEDAYTTDASNYNWAGSGTSAAGAIIAGVALIVQGMLDAAGEPRLTPIQMQRLLRDRSGTHAQLPFDPDAIVGPSDVGAAWYAGPAGIGIMPDLQTLIDDSFGLTASAMMRVSVADGAFDMELPPHRYQSPDIIILHGPVSNPQAAYGPGSGTEGDLGISVTPKNGIDSIIYVRVTNNGGMDATDVRVHLYHGPAATFVGAHMLRPIGVAHVPSVPAHTELVVSSRVMWPGTDIPGEPVCLVAFIGTATAPPPPPDQLTTLQRHTLALERRWMVIRNHHAASTAPDTPGPGRVVTTLPFMLQGAPNEDVVMRVEVRTGFPIGCNVFLALPEDSPAADWDLVGAITPHPGDPARLHLPTSGTWRSRAVLVPRGARVRARLLIEIPTALRSGSYRVAAAQTVDDEPIGRVSWVMKP